ncbi:reverse transcriptase domain-containing protein [Tanacetum coccineum]
MPPRMTTQSAGLATAAPRGGRTGGRTGRGGGRTGGRSSDQSDGRNDGQGGQVGGQGREGDVGNVIENNDHRGCTYKEFLACNLKELSRGGKRGREAVVGMSWEDFKTLTSEEFCQSNEMQKLETELWNHAMVRASHAAYTDRFHQLARLVPHLVTPEVAATEPKTIQKAVQISSTLADEALRNASIKKNPEKRGNGGEPSKDRNVRDDNKRSRTRNAFAQPQTLSEEKKRVASDDLRDALSVIFGLSELKEIITKVMSADSTITYTFVHSEARSWSIPSEDPYEEAARQLLEQAPHSPEYVPDPIELEDHVPVYIPEPDHPEDSVPAEDEAPTPPLPPLFLSLRI